MSLTRTGFEALANIGDVPEQGVLGVTRSNGERICLIRREGAITAVSDICTHQEFAMSAGDILPDGTIQCAWHGTRFDCATGEVKQIPATDPLPVYEVRVDGGKVMVGALRRRTERGYEPSIAKVSE